MSLIRITSKFLSFAPRVYLKRDSLHIETPLWAAALLLFLRFRHIEVDRLSEYVRVSTRWFWFFADVRFIPFRHIKHLYYEYDELPTDGVFTGSAVMATDSIEQYRIGLVLNRPDNERVHLFRTAGESAKATGLAGVLLGDDLIDFQGIQEARSLKLVDLLGKFIGVPIGPHGKVEESSRAKR